MSNIKIDLINQIISKNFTVNPYIYDYSCFVNWKYYPLKNINTVLQMIKYQYDDTKNTDLFFLNNNKLKATNFYLFHTSNYFKNTIDVLNEFTNLYFKNPNLKNTTNDIFYENYEILKKLYDRFHISLDYESFSCSNFNKLYKSTKSNNFNILIHYNKITISFFKSLKEIVSLLFKPIEDIFNLEQTWSLNNIDVSTALTKNNYLQWLNENFNPWLNKHLEQEEIILKYDNASIKALKEKYLTDLDYCINYLFRWNDELLKPKYLRTLDLNNNLVSNNLCFEFTNLFHLINNIHETKSIKLSYRYLNNLLNIFYKLFLDVTSIYFYFQTHILAYRNTNLLLNHTTNIYKQTLNKIKDDFDALINRKDVFNNDDINYYTNLEELWNLYDGIFMLSRQGFFIETNFSDRDEYWRQYAKNDQDMNAT